MVSHHRRVDGPARLTWSYLARPGLWRAWAPHLRGAWGLGDPEVEEGRSGAVRLAGFIPVPVRITAKEAGRSWTWRAGPYLMEHRVEPRGESCEVFIDVSAHPALERVLAATYGHLISHLLGRLATVVADDAGDG